MAYYTGNSNVRLQSRVGLNAGLNAFISEVNTLRIFTDYFKQGGHEEVFAGALYGTVLSASYDDNLSCTLYLGCSYRWNDALVPTLKLDWYKIDLGISYDINVSKLKSASSWRGGLEVTACYKTRLHSRSQEANKVRCVR